MGCELLLETGTEEIPAAFIPAALEALERGFLAEMGRLGIPVGATRTMGTPRRLVLHASGMASRRPVVRRTVTGPPKRVGIDDQGNLTRAGQGFARSQKADPADVFVTETPKGLYLAVEKQEGGEPVLPLLEGVLPGLLRSLHFRKSMRWGDKDLRFVRPIHWIVAVFDGEVVPFELGGVAAGNASRGLRFYGPRTFLATDLETYLAACRAGRVEPDPAIRRKRIAAELTQQAAQVGGVADVDPALLEEAVFLTECPRVITGRFDPGFLDLPPEVPVTVMKHHQKYFPVYGPDGALLPHFLAVLNTPAADVGRIVHGNERVLRARLVDARFFCEEDLKTPLAGRVDGLAGVTFHARLGTSLEKVERMTRLAETLATRLFPGDTALLEKTTRAARLAKADLVTSMVGEFPELQGVMGRIYAARQGEAPEVARAIGEHYLPVQAGGPLPQSDIGAIVGIADKLDSVAGFIAVGLTPTAAADPFALRRQTLGVLHTLLDRGWNIPMGDLVDVAVELLAPRCRKPRETVREEVLTFIKTRFRGLLSSLGATADLVEAVLAAGYERVPDTVARLKALRELSSRGEFASLMTAFKRAVNISRDQPDAGAVALENLLPVESALLDATERVHTGFAEDIAAGNYDRALSRLVELKEPIDRFFDEVLVMDPDETVRLRRLAILHRVSALFRGGGRPEPRIDRVVARPAGPARDTPAGRAVPGRSRRSGCWCRSWGMRKGATAWGSRFFADSSTASGA